MWLAQNKMCYICGDNKSAVKSLVIDHDHKCCPANISCGKCIRGLICSFCNRGLGVFYDNSELLRRAAEYLENPPGVV